MINTSYAFKLPGFFTYEERYWTFPFSTQGGGTMASLEYLLRIKTALNWAFDAKTSVLSPKE